MSEPFLTIVEAAKCIANRETSAAELVTACLGRIDQREPTLNAFITLTREAALQAAETADKEIAASGVRGRLHGIPIGLKDNIDTRGIRTTAHSKLFQERIPNRDATCVERLTQAGVISIGKTVLHEFAMDGPSFDLPWPPARNPWDSQCFPAGSSSGTAVAVAAGMILGGLGSDTGGSIRGPAALCGIAGLKATYGRISRSGVFPLAYSLDHVGPMAWTVEDCAILLQALAGTDPNDPSCSDQPVADYCSNIHGDIRGVRIGLIRHFLEDDVDVAPAVRQGVDHAVSIYRELGAVVCDVRLSSLQDWNACGFIIMMAEAYAIHEDSFKLHYGEYGNRMRESVAMGAFLSAADYIQAIRRRRELCMEMAAVMADVDVLLTAGANAEAPLMTDVPQWDFLKTPTQTMPFNVTGYPALSICTGFGAGGLPVGMQLVARPFEEALLLRVGQAYEDASPWRQQRPR